MPETPSPRLPDRDRPWMMRTYAGHSDAKRSNELYRRVVEMAPDTARFWYNLATSERSFGRLAEAEAACDRAIAL